MKQIVAHIIAVIIIATVVFAIFFWVVNFTLEESIIIGLSGAVGGMGGEMIIKELERRKQRKLNRITERTSE